MATKTVKSTMPTVAQLRRFVRTRNRSDFASNLQFQIDADACGFSINDMGKVSTFTIDGVKGYRWMVRARDGDTVRGIELVEFGPTLHMLGEPGEDEFFAFLTDKAEAA